MKTKLSPMERRERRRQLLSEKPCCELCGRRLQGETPQAIDYAHVFDDHLECGVCAHVTNGRRAAQRERELAERAVELSPDEQREFRRYRRRSFLKNDRPQRAELRRHLMAECPRCWNCGRQLQQIDPRDAETYACVVLHAEKLTCVGCANIVAAVFTFEPVEA